MYARKYKVILVEKQQQKSTVIPTHKIIHPCLDIIVVKCIHNIPRIVCNRNQSCHGLQRCPICLIESDHGYIIDEIVHRDKIEYEININAEYEK